MTFAIIANEPALDDPLVWRFDETFEEAEQSAKPVYEATIFNEDGSVAKTDPVGRAPDWPE